jgi:hypothetical protein
MATFFTRKVLSEGNRQELYVYFRGHLIYKVWYVAGQKQYSRLFHEGEGLTLGAKASIHENKHAS